MSSSSPDPAQPPADGASPEQQALRDALAALLAPVARLAVTRGLPFAAVEEMLKLAFVQAAADAHPGLLAHRKVSRISTSTGINRREVTRLTQQAPRTEAAGRTFSGALFATWMSDPSYRGPDSQPLVLPRTGQQPSFETLAQSVTRDVHPRSLLEEMLRLGMATWDEQSDLVTVAAAAVPKGEKAGMLGHLGRNVADHLEAAVDNVLGDTPAHFEMALSADGLSDSTADWLKEQARSQWRQLREQLVPELERRLEADAGSASELRRWRMGLYSYDRKQAAASEEKQAEPSAKPKASRSPRRGRTE